MSFSSLLESVHPVQMNVPLPGDTYGHFSIWPRALKLEQKLYHRFLKLDCVVTGL